jgi:hypothetical protein
MTQCEIHQPARDAALVHSLIGVMTDLHGFLPVTGIAPKPAIRGVIQAIWSLKT